MIKRLLLASSLLLPLCGPLWAQQVVLPCTKSGTSCIPATTSSPLTTGSVGAPNMAVSQVNVGVSATQVVAARSTRQSVTITNTNTVAVYCGPTNAVTTSNGFWIPGVIGQTQVFSTTGAVWCVTGSGTELVSVAETYY